MSILTEKVGDLDQ